MSDAAGQIEQVVFNPGDILFTENETSYHFYILQEGQVEVFKMGPGGVKVPLAVVGEGTSIGEFAMIDRLPRSATARALTRVEAAKISDAAYQQLLQELPDWAVAVMKGLVDRLRQTNEIIRSNAILSGEVRKQIEAIEYDTEVSNPILGSGSDDDV